MITVTMSVGVDADRHRVWRALTRPVEVVAWNPARFDAADVPDDYPRPQAAARWRYRLRGIPMVLIEKPVEVLPPERFRSELRLALVRFDQTWTLAEEAGDPKSTRVSLKLVSPNAIPVVGGLLDRFGVRAFAQASVDETLRALRAWCQRPRARA